ncbi:tRNA (adenosine(37)-N6)-threonylcarbamoyltransferase complex dimerization subunit type 1 TsaB [Desulfurobacterium sp.]
MKILGIDTCLPLGSVALIDGKNVLLSRSWNSTREHASKVFEALNLTLGTGKNRFNSIDLMVFTAGPGSFTGIRICLSLAKAFKEAFKNKNIEIGTVSTLEALSFSFLKEKRPVFVIMEARKNKYYIYCRSHEKVLLEPEDLPAEEVIKRINAIPGTLIVTGNFNPSSEIGNFIQSSEKVIEKRARTSIALNAALYAVNYGYRESLEPIYVRQPDAKPPGKKLAD